MNTGNSLIWCILLIMFVFTFVFLMEMIIPISKKYELNRISRQFQIIIEDNGGLTTQERKDLEKTLEDHDFLDIQVTAPKPGTIKFGESIEFIVEVVYKKNQLKSLFQRSNQSFIMRYRITTLSRRVVN